MGINRSKIAKQLLAEGGEVSLKDAKKMAPKGEFLAYINKKEAQMLKDAGGSGIMTPLGIPSFVDFGSGRGSVAESLSEAAGLSGPSSDSGGNGDSAPPQGVRTGDVFPGLSKVTPRDVFKVSGDNPMLHRSMLDRMIIGSLPGGKLINLGERFAYDLPAFRYTRTGGKKTIGPYLSDSEEEEFKRFSMPLLSNSSLSRTDDLFDLYSVLEGREAARFGQAPTGISRGMQRFNEGGEVRQKYGLGSLVKKITKPIKKLSKSKIGKAALIAAGIYGLGKVSGGSSLTGGPFSGIKKFLLGSSSAAGERGIVKSPGLLQKLFLKKGETDFSLGALDPLKVAGITATVSPFLLTPDQEDEETLDQRIARTYGTDRGIDIPGIRKAALGYSDPNELYFKLPQAFRLGAAEGGTIDDEYFARKDKELEKLIEEGMSLEEALQKVFPGTKSSVEFTREELGLEPLPEGKAEGGIMDLGGKEMDLRGGGFVPIGAKEKADDVPARLSKNEFVFTADAVRGAGGGSVEKGAQKMYNTMKQLEEMV